MRRSKREAPLTVYAPPEIKAALKEVARREDRSVSTWLLRLAEQNPSVQIALQQLGRTDWHSMTANDSSSLFFSAGECTSLHSAFPLFFYPNRPVEHFVTLRRCGFVTRL